MQPMTLALIFAATHRLWSHRLAARWWLCRYVTHRDRNRYLFQAVIALVSEVIMLGVIATI